MIYIYRCRNELFFGVGGGGGGGDEPKTPTKNMDLCAGMSNIWGGGGGGGICSQCPPPPPLLFLLLYICDSARQFRNEYSLAPFKFLASL